MTHAIEIRNVPPRLPRDSDKLDYSLSRLRDVVREPIFHTNHLLTGQICQLESSTNVWDPWRRRTYYYHITVLIISGSVTHPQHRTLVLNEPHIVARNEPELRD